MSGTEHRKASCSCFLRFPGHRAPASPPPQPKDTRFLGQQRSFCAPRRHTDRGAGLDASSFTLPAAQRWARHRGDCHHCRAAGVVVGHANHGLRPARTGIAVRDCRRVADLLAILVACVEHELRVSRSSVPPSVGACSGTPGRHLFRNGGSALLAHACITRATVCPFGRSEVSGWVTCPEKIRNGG